MLPQPSVHGLSHSVQKYEKEGDLQSFYVRMQKSGLESHKSLCSSLVLLLINAGDKSQQVFDPLLCRGILHCKSRISDESKLRKLQNTIELCQRLQMIGHMNLLGHTVVALLRNIGKLKDIELCISVHNGIVKKGHLQKNPFVGSALVDTYAKCGMFDKAKEVFDLITLRDVVLWTAMIGGFCKGGENYKAFEYLEQMKIEGVFPNAATVVCTLRACAMIGALDKGRQLHAEIVNSVPLQIDSNVGNALVNMYCAHGSLSMAEHVFGKLLTQDVVTWTTLISAYSKTNKAGKALNSFNQMQMESVIPDAITIVFCLKSCGKLDGRCDGVRIHTRIENSSLLERDIHVGAALIEMYAKFGLLDRARYVFERLNIRDVVLWNLLSAGYCEHGFHKEVLSCFEQMQIEGVAPDSMSYNFLLKSCGNVGDIQRGKEIHVELEREGFLARDVIASTALVQMYAKCCLHAESQNIFNQLRNRDVISFNALITGYIENDLEGDALLCFEKMQLHDVSPNVVTFVCILRACTMLGAIGKGQSLHAEIERCGLLQGDIIGNALINMYSQCACLTKAHQVLHRLDVRDVISWTALMAGHAKIGETEEVFQIFAEMLYEGVKPNLITFIIILNACSRSGLSDVGHTYLQAMEEDYGIIPVVDHHACVIDLLGRTGNLQKAAVALQRMPIRPNIVLWNTVLDACRKWGNLNIGKWAFQCASNLDESYVLPCTSM